MPSQLMRPEVLLLIVFVLWGIAGKLDEPLGGFDPEPELASIHAGRYPIGGAVHVELCTADRDLPEPLATLSCNLAPSCVALADDELCVKSWSEHEPLIEPMLATGLFEGTGGRTRTGHAVSPTWRIKDPQFVPPRR